MINHRLSSKLPVMLVFMAWCHLAAAQEIGAEPYLGQSGNLRTKESRFLLDNNMNWL